MDTIRVLVADDHPVVRRGPVALLSSLEGVSVVGEAEDGESAVREALLLAPDVVAMDIQMPGTDGIEATRRLTAAVPGCAVLVLSMFETDESVVTVRERQVLDHLAAGRTNSAIADTLGLSVKTVSNHVSSVFAKLGVATRAEAVVLGREHGLGGTAA